MIAGGAILAAISNLEAWISFGDGSDWLGGDARTTMVRMI